MKAYGQFLQTESLVRSKTLGGYYPKRERKKLPKENWINAMPNGKKK